MKKTLLVGCLSAVAVLTAGCGGASAEETKAVKSLSTVWNGSETSAARKASNECIAKKFVGAVGVEKLIKEKVIDKTYRSIGQTVPEKMSKDTATAFGNAVADCFDVESMRDDLAKSMQGLDDKTLDGYITCMDDIDPDLIAQAVRDGKIGGPTGKPTKPMADLQTVVKACQDKAQPTQ